MLRLGSHGADVTARTKGEVSMERVETKKVWEEPKLFVHGNVEQITQARDDHKGLGTSDGLLFGVILPSVVTRRIS
jgi:hypothetical protein